MPETRGWSSQSQLLCPQTHSMVLHPDRVCSDQICCRQAYMMNHALLRRLLCRLSAIVRALRNFLRMMALTLTRKTRQTTREARATLSIFTACVYRIIFVP